MLELTASPLKEKRKGPFSSSPFSHRDKKYFLPQTQKDSPKSIVLVSRVRLREQQEVSKLVTNVSSKSQSDVNVLKKISKYIQEQNEQVYAPRGLLLTDPVERGMRVVSSWAGWAGGHGAGKMGTDEPGGTGAGTA
ncbi:Golgin subfamily A member 7B [Chelonia mydas]|uniref:Golgin subfamily A member 7B n=1 Tax=Chelonia mydas TaxID=8469 RepID=M7BL49_CHEMY|nr:Golgin subfamily A member 7B [Chelonia mydas]